MEILSVGEKIKRARIYKGATLKDICGDKISVSKMSCIENDKIRPEYWVLEFIAEKLDLNIDYLLKDVKQQIISNLDLLEKQNFSKDVEEKLYYNLDYALQYNYYDLGFKIIHLLFDQYIKENRFESIQLITSQYYDLSQKSDIEYNKLIYYKDMAKYFYLNGEYSQASTYYNAVRKSIRDSNIEDYDLLTSVAFNEAACYIMLKNYERAYEVAIRLKEMLPYVKDDTKKAEVYQILSIISFKMGKDNFSEYEQKSYKYYGNNGIKKSKAMLNYAIAMFEFGEEQKPIEYIEEGLSVYPKDDEEGYVEYMLMCIDELVKYNVLEVAQKICEDALDNAISCDNIRFIERAYYFKSIILQKQGKYKQSEMYMNLAVDALFKFGNKRERYDRYLEMGNMYYKLGEVREAIKYYSLAMAVEKKM